jgi:putative Mg2+ transporter-C (MgtC) family protein
MSQGNSLIDPTRISAQVVSGIGFLGALCVLKDKNTILGLTTASSIWVMACIGIAVGGGFILGAVTTTVLILINLIFVPKIKRLIKKSSIYKRNHNNCEE